MPFGCVQTDGTEPNGGRQNVSSITDRLFWDARLNTINFSQHPKLWWCGCFKMLIWEHGGGGGGLCATKSEEDC